MHALLHSICVLISISSSLAGQRHTPVAAQILSEAISNNVDNILMKLKLADQNKFNSTFSEPIEKGDFPVFAY
jgi:hypothetical protein